MRVFVLRKIMAKKKQVEISEQGDLFARASASVDDERLVLCALGDFQVRGKKELANRQLPLDRLRGAMRRTAEVLAIEELTDERFAQALERLGAKVVRVPTFVAKHPFRVTVSEDLAGQARTAFVENSEKA